MKLIQSQYRGYYKNEDEILFALSVMNRLYAEWDYSFIEKALYQFMSSDNKGYPPVPGQLITLAADIKHKEYEERKKLLELPEPDRDKEPMPEDIKHKLKALLGR